MSKPPKPSAAAPDRPFPWRPILALGIALLALALFWPATGFGFIEYDDPLYVRDNVHVATGLSPANLRWAFTNAEQQWWVPLVWLSFMLDTELFGPAPFGYHLVNVLLHAFNAGLLFWVLSRMTKSIWPAAAVAALFAVHPQRVEAVAWITARKDVLSGLFFFLALLAYLRHAEKPSAARMAAVAALMLCGLMSKAILIVLPPILLLLDFWPLRRAGDPLDRREWKTWGRLLLEKWPLILLAAVFVGIGLTTHTTGRGGMAQYSAATRLGLVPPNYWAYVAKILWPHPLSIIYPERDVAVPWVAVLALLGLGLATAVLFRMRRRHPAPLVGWLWFLVALLPVVRGLRLGIASMADRFAYVPSVGFFLLVVWACADLLPRNRGRRILPAALALGLLAASFLAARGYLWFWVDSETLFRHCLAATQGNYTVETNLANVLFREKRKDEAIVHWRNAVDILPHYALVHAALAVALRETGQPEESARHLELAAQHVLPREADVMAGIAMEYAIAGRDEKALDFFRRSFEIRPDQPEAQLDMAATYLKSGRPLDALACADRVLELHPDVDRAHFSRAQALLALDRPAEAIPALRTAARLLPSKIEYRSALAVALSSAGQSAEAVAVFRRLLREKPDTPELLNNLACLLAENPDAAVRDPAAAVSYALRAAELTGRKDVLVLDTLAMAYAANGQFGQAVSVCEEAEPLARKLRRLDLADQIRRRAEACRKEGAAANYGNIRK